MTEDLHGPGIISQIVLGFNYRMTDIHAALGITQMQRIKSLSGKDTDFQKHIMNFND